MKDVFVIDACALIAFLADEEGADKVEGILKDARNGKCRLYINKVNLLEIYYGIYREDGKEKAEEVLKRLSNLPVKVINGLKNNVFTEAGRLKATYSISLADSIVVAEAITKKARLMTSDHHEFDEIEEKETMNFYWIR
ncbi:MAG: type II toxin-antitoxin system VapC family toxin [Candidatus Aminicenantes bacterium]|jgi:predicted nucleic acid-binding protein